MWRLLSKRNQKEFWRWAWVFCLGVLFIKIDWQDYLIVPLLGHMQSIRKAFINFFQ
jgi:hypothetical protein